MVSLKDLLNQPTSSNVSSPVLASSKGESNSGITHLPSPSFTYTAVTSGGSDTDFDEEEDFMNKKDGSISKEKSSPAAETVVTPTKENTADDLRVVDPKLKCEWGNCDKTFEEAEFLYHHLCQNHVGRKSQKNLQLCCNWKNCKVITEKRDHITSHLRVHIPLKPFSCSTCTKKFKRPQDLKKHLKIHVTDDSQLMIKKKRGPKTRKDKERELQLAMQMQNYQMTSNQHSPASIAQSPTNELQTLLPKELFSLCDPNYSQHFISRLKTVLPPISNDQYATFTGINKNDNNNLFSNAPINNTASSAMFFSNLSRDMTSPFKPFSNHGTPFRQQLQTITPRSQVFRPSPIFGQSTTPALPMLSNIGVNAYPELPHLPSPLTNVHNGQYQQSSILPPIKSLSTFNQRYEPFNKMPVFNVQAESFSTSQKSNGKNTDDHATAIGSLELDDEYIDVLNTVNIIRDYLICSLLEEEFEDAAEDDADDEDIEEFSKLYDSLSISPIALSKYPKIVI